MEEDIKEKEEKEEKEEKTNSTFEINNNLLHAFIAAGLFILFVNQANWLIIYKMWPFLVSNIIIVVSIISLIVSFYYGFFNSKCEDDAKIKSPDTSEYWICEHKKHRSHKIERFLTYTSVILFIIALIFSLVGMCIQYAK